MFFKIFTLAIKGLFNGDVAVLAMPLIWICVVLIGPNVVAQAHPAAARAHAMASAPPRHPLEGHDHVHVHAHVHFHVPWLAVGF